MEYNFKHFVLRCGNMFISKTNKKEESNYKKTVLNRINENKSPIWGFNEVKSNKKNENNLQTYIQTGENVIIWILPNKSEKANIEKEVISKPCDCIIVKRVRKRDLGPLISLDDTNEELGWTDGNSIFEYLIEHKKWFHIKDMNISFDGCGLENWSQVTLLEVQKEEYKNKYNDIFKKICMDYVLEKENNIKVF